MNSQAALDVAIDCGSQCFAAAESAERIKWLENRFDTARLKIVLKDNIHSEVLRQTNGTGMFVLLCSLVFNPIRSIYPENTVGQGLYRNYAKIDGFCAWFASWLVCLYKIL